MVDTDSFAQVCNKAKFIKAGYIGFVKSEMQGKCAHDFVLCFILLNLWSKHFVIAFSTIFTGVAMAVLFLLLMLPFSTIFTGVAMVVLFLLLMLPFSTIFTGVVMVVLFLLLMLPFSTIFTGVAMVVLFLLLILPFSTIFTGVAMVFFPLLLMLPFRLLYLSFFKAICLVRHFYHLHFLSKGFNWQNCFHTIHCFGLVIIVKNCCGTLYIFY